MSTFDPTVHALVRRIYCPTLGLGELAAALLPEFVRLVGATGGRLRFSDGAAIEHGRPCHEPPRRWSEPVGALDAPVHAAEWQSTPAHASPAPRPALTHTAPLIYGGQAFGELSLRWDGGPPGASFGLCTAFARELAVLASRHAVRSWTRERFDQALLLVGLSPQLRDVEAAVERAGETDLPVILRGEFGTEVVAIAVSLHCGGTTRTAPFVELHCPSLGPAEAAQALACGFERAAAGTLFLCGVEALPLAAQMQLMRLMPSSLGQCVNGRSGPQPRLVASTSADLRQLVRDGLFLRALLNELDVLSIEVPPARARTGDMRYLVRYFLHKRGFSVAHKWSDELLAACEAYVWPENLFEVERALARLGVMTGDAPILTGDVARHAPWLLAAPGGAAPDREVPGPEGEPPPGPAAAPSAAPPDIDGWIRAIVARDFTAVPALHDCLRRALLYIGDHYQEPISLTQLARSAHVSPSHLSFLFKQALGTNFKLVLARLRIEKAKLLLAQNGHQRITEVAANAGFTDLSHFEKTFRRFVAVCPREYRSRLVAAPAP
jgi:AraC-like DNA-binding protein